MMKSKSARKRKVPSEIEEAGMAGNEAAGTPVAVTVTVSAPTATRLLVACGCNSHGQLYISENDRKAYANDIKDGGENLGDEGGYVFSTIEEPTIVAEAEESLTVLYVGVNTICYERDGTLYLRGLAPRLHASSKVHNAIISGGQCELPLIMPHEILDHESIGDWDRQIEASDVLKAFGTRWAFLGIHLNYGPAYTFNVKEWKFERFDPTGNLDLNLWTNDIQVNRVGHCCFHMELLETDDEADWCDLIVYHDASSLKNNAYEASMQSITDLKDIMKPIAGNQERKLTAIIAGPKDSEIKATTIDHEPNDYITDVKACATTFVALTKHGRILTAGDGKFNSLGRQKLADEPMYHWDYVEALGGIQIEKIAASPGGYIQMALAEEGTAYIWGGTGNELIDGLPSNEASADEIGMIDLTDESGEAIEFQDVAVGDDHAILIENEGKGLWIAGESDSGQLGFGIEYTYRPHAIVGNSESRIKAGKWRKWSDDMLGSDFGGDDKIEQVTCGPGSTLVVVEKDLPMVVPEVTHGRKKKKAWA